MKPAVAIITRTKNRPLLLGRAISSVLGQRLADWQHIIVNDGGTPEDVEALVAEHKDAYNGRVTLLHNPESLGMEAASNVGIKASDSTYVIIHDDDDSWEPEFLERMVKLLQNHQLPGNIAGAVCYATRIDEKMTDTSVTEISREDFNGDMRHITLWDSCAHNRFPPISFLYKRDVLEHTGLYNEALPVLGDWEFNLRFLSHYDIALLPEHLAFYHHRVKHDTSAYANTVTGEIAQHEIYHAYLRNHLLREDIAANRLGIGHLINLNRDLYQTQAKFEYSHHMHRENHKLAAKNTQLLDNIKQHQHHINQGMDKATALLDENRTIQQQQMQKLEVIYTRMEKLVSLFRPIFRPLRRIFRRK